MTRIFLSLAVTALASLPEVSINGYCYRGLSAAEPNHTALMPGVDDYTHMWWAEGFPDHTPSAPWRRCIQTGRYAMVLDTETIQIPHFGPLTTTLDYDSCARADNRIWQTLPAADLDLEITVDGKVYRCTGGGKWTRFGGPRLIESGRFVQRADVTNLVFAADDGTELNVEARFETTAWPDRLALVLAARPGLAPIVAGEKCFGRLGGGYGLDGANHLEIPHERALDAQRFTLEFWAFVPVDCQVSPRTPPWLACKNGNEYTEGNYGILLLGNLPRAMLNIGGGRENCFFVNAGRQKAVKTNAWNHLAMSYNGDTLRLYVNGDPAGEKRIARNRIPGSHGLAFGRRQDNSGDGYYFRGAVDEIRFYHRALTPSEIKQRVEQPEVDDPDTQPVRQWSFRADGHGAASQPRLTWRDAAMEIRLRSRAGLFEQRRSRSASDIPPPRTSRPQNAAASAWYEVGLALSFDHPDTPVSAYEHAHVVVEAYELPTVASRPVEYDETRGWHRVNLDGIVPRDPPGDRENGNNGIERVKLVLTNPDSTERVVRLLFEKNRRGFRTRIGSAITGMSAVLRDADGHPTGIPVQLSKNWHSHPEAGVCAGAWFHGFSQVRVPPKDSIELELAIVYGHWGGVAAASHAQLCLIGWGSNQLWDESALGSWGESICYEPDQAQAHAAVLDVRPVMVRSMNGARKWNWTHNVGGGDFFRLFDSTGNRVFPARMRTAYHRQGPCLTEVTYAGHTGRALEHSATVSLARSDDIVRGIYRLRLDITKPVDFSRFVIFQIGADSYSYTGERKMALGDETGISREWEAHWGSNTYRTTPIQCKGRVPWISLHDAVSRATEDESGAWANRGVVIRFWKAKLGGRNVLPWVAEHGVKARGVDTSTIDIVPPPGITRLERGDFIEATVEHIVMPQFAEDYYGPNDELRAALSKWENTWRMIYREAVENERSVETTTGRLERRHPAVHIVTEDDRAEFTIRGGLGYVPVTFANLTMPRDYSITVDGRPLDQSVHGNDFWQTDHDPRTRRWEITYNLPLEDRRPHVIRFSPRR